MKDFRIDLKIDLRSDTVTKPSQGMKEAMMKAELGDDVLGDDPTVAELESYCCELFQMDAALFFPTGTMTNQIAIALWASAPLSEVIIEGESHVYQYEVGGIAWNSRAQVKCLPDPEAQGKLKPAILEKYLKDSGFPAQNPHKAHPRLVSLENSTNRGGGVCYRQSEIEEIHQICKNYDLKLHLDGARVFNALTVTKQSPAELARPFDSISICLSKGLGAPLGSVLLTRGSSSMAFLARKLRKVMGGGMRQSGIVAAAGLYALKNNIPLLAKDHEGAKVLAQTLATLPYVKSVQAGETNILIFELQSNVSPEKYLNYLKENNLLAMGFGGQFIRFVTHLDFTDSMLKQSLEIIKGFPIAR